MIKEEGEKNMDKKTEEKKAEDNSAAGGSAKPAPYVSRENTGLPEKTGIKAGKKEKKEKKEKKKMEPKKKKRIIRWTVILVILVAVIAFFVYNKSKAAGAAVPVPTVEAFEGDVESTISTSGFVNSEETKTYYAPVDVQIEDLNVEAGDPVKVGQKLLGYDTQALERQSREAELTAKENESDYQSAIANSAEQASDFTTSSVNVETYKSMIVAQRAYINDLNQAVAQRTEDAECIAEGNRKKQSEIADKIAEKTAELNKLSNAQAGSGTGTTTPTVSGNSADTQKITDLKNEIASLERDSSKLGTTSIPSGATPEETRKITEAQTLLGDMEGYLGEDKGIKKAAEEGILDKYQRAKLEASREKAQMKAQQAKEDLEKAADGVLAEFNGIVTELSVENGAVALAGAKLIKVENSDNVKVVISVNKYDLEKIRVGLKADIDIAGHMYKGSLTKINRMAHKNDSGSMVVGTEIHIDNPDENIYLGVEAKVVVHLKEAKGVVLIPVEAINTDRAGEFCYVVENNVIVRKPVETGVTSDTYVEVTKGLKAGDSVVSQVTSNIAEGMQVIATPDPTAQMMQQREAAEGASAEADTKSQAADGAEADTESQAADGAEADTEGKAADGAELESQAADGASQE